MRANTKKRKRATVMLKATQEQEWWADQVVQVMLHGKRALDAAMLDVGRLVAETLMYMEREERSGPDYHPTSSGLMKWASQRGSIELRPTQCRNFPFTPGKDSPIATRSQWNTAREHCPGIGIGRYYDKRHIRKLVRGRAQHGSFQV